MQKKILAVCYDTGAANALFRPILKFQEDRKLEIVVLADGPAENILRSKSITPKTLRDYRFDQTNLENIDSIIKKEKPDLIFSGFSSLNMLEKYFIHISKSNNIPSFTVLDMYINYLKSVSDLDLKEPFKFMPDYICVMDEIAFDGMIKQGFDKNKLIITGQPYFDDLNEFRTSFTLLDRGSIKKELGIDLDSYLITFFSQARRKYINKDPTQNNGYDELIVLSELEEALSTINIDNLNLLIKLHPEEEIENTRGALKGKLNKVVFNKEYKDTRRISLATDLVTGMFSTCLIEAVYLDKNVVSIQPNLVGEDFLATNKVKLSVPIYRERDLQKTLEKVIYDEIYRDELKKRRSKILLDGKATDRIVSRIYKLLNLPY